jgi:hypothetical protein
MTNPLGTSKETTIAGLLGGIAIIAGQLQNLFDSDPATTCDMTLIAAALAMIVGFARARDNNKTSEAVGLK